MAGEKALGRLRLAYIVATDVFHAVIGMFAVFVMKYLSYAFPFNVIAMLSIMAVFYGYQIQDDDSPEEKICDILEFTAGLVVGQAL